MNAISAAKNPARIHIQVHLDRAPGFNQSLLRKEYEALQAQERALARFRIEEGEDHGRYLNIEFATSDIIQLWQALQSAIYQHPVIGKELMMSSMVMCTGASGWDDYLLLHHYDSTVAQDKF